MMISIYLATWVPDFSSFFPTVILLAGFAMSYYLGQRITYDSDLDASDVENIGFWTIAAFAGIMLGGVATSYLYLIPNAAALPMSGFNVVLYGILMAVAEENLFRGAVLGFLSRQFPAMGAVMASAAIFSVYHFSIYRTDASALIYAFVAGAILSWVVLRTGRLSPAILAHVANNLVALLWV